MSVFSPLPPAAVAAFGAAASDAGQCASVSLLLAAALCLLAGWGGVLAGLSGKPRPTGQAAALALGVAAVARLAAAAC